MTKTKRKKAKSPAATAINPNHLKIEQTVKNHWNIGKEIDVFCKAKPGNTIGVYASKYSIPERRVRTLRTFYKAYEEEELKELLSIRREATGRPLHSGHIAYLLTIRSEVHDYGNTAKKARQKFAKEAAKNNYSPAQLNAAIKRACGRSSENRGKPLDVSNLDVAMHLVAKEAVSWTKRYMATWEKASASDCKQLKSLLLACKDFCEAAALIDNRKKSDKEGLIKRVEEAQAKLAVLLEQTMVME